MYRNQNGKIPGHRILVESGQENRRIDNFLLAEFKGLPRSRIYQMLRKGEVRVNGGRKKPSYKLVAGDRIRVPPLRLPEEATPSIPPGFLQARVQKAVLYEDDSIIVLNKPAGITVHGGSGRTWGIIEILRYLRGGDSGLQLVHRLDQETSGCLLIAKNYQTLRQIHEALQAGTVIKSYLALVQGSLPEGCMDVSAPLAANRLKSGERMVEVDQQGKTARSRFLQLQEFADASLVEVSLMTGRTHQIRVHADYLGHPLAGDKKYGNREFNRQLKKLGLRRCFLHAVRIHLPDGCGFSRVEFEAPLPGDLQRMLTILEQRSCSN